MDQRNSPTPRDRSAPDARAPATTLADETDDFDDVLRALARPPAGPRFASDAPDGEISGADGVREAVRDVFREASRAGSEPAVGDVIDHGYRVLSLLGRGGMGVVLSAENLRTGKHVAIKWMSHERGALLTPKVVERFRREARAVAKVQHDNVVDIYDSGESDGTPFIVMEQLEGESLRQRIARGALPWADARELMLGVLRGVSAVHRAHVVHRDLKPDNVFLCAREGALPTPKVLDFGIAAMRSGADALDTLTRTGSLIGTPSYMALEQLTGGEVDERSDVYALGVVLYEMLTQKLPFAGRTTGDLAVLQATGSPARLSTHLPALRGAREQLVMRALARRPEDRYPSVHAFAAALESERGGARKAYLGPIVVLTLLAATAALVYALGVDAPRATEPPAPAARQPVESAAAPAPALREQSTAPDEPSATDETPSVPRTPASRLRRAASRGRSEASTTTESEPVRALESVRERTEIRLDDF